MIKTVSAKIGELKLLVSKYYVRFTDSNKIKFDNVGLDRIDICVANAVLNKDPKILDDVIVKIGRQEFIRLVNIKLFPKFELVDIVDHNKKIWKFALAEEKPNKKPRRLYIFTK